MKRRLLDIIRCPQCSGRLELIVLNQEEDKIFLENKISLYSYFKIINISLEEWASLYKDEILSGILYCQCEKSYPVIDGVPRLLQSAEAEYKKFYHINRKLLPRIIQNKFVTKNINNSKSTKSGFQFQWGKYDYDQTTWFKSLAVRKIEFLDNFNISKEDLKGKLIYDAGCGNGRLSASMATFGCEVVALDYTGVWWITPEECI